MKFFICLLSLVLSATSSFAISGKEGGGGHVLAAEFSDLAVTLLEKATRAAESVEVRNKKISTEALLDQARAMKVKVSEEKLFLKGAEVMAINWPETQEVLFHKNSWIGLTLSEKERLVIHEVLGLMQVDDSSYEASREIITLTSSILHGSDSSWRLCHNNTLVVNTLEHRAGLDTRATEITLIIGMHIFTGKLDDVDEGNIRMTSKSKDSEFVGYVKQDYSRAQFLIKGTLLLNGTKFKLNYGLKCEDLAFDL